MKQFEHKEGKKAELVPFMQYYPTYSSMDKQQKEWYFYWRSQVRKGEKPCITHPKEITVTLQ